jgi:hypothetical protein
MHKLISILSVFASLILLRPAHADESTLTKAYIIKCHQLTAGFIPDSKEVILGEPLFVTFVISNREDRAFHFSHVRNEIFSITASNAIGLPVKNIFLGFEGNGFASKVTLPPRKDHRMRLFLNERCQFAQPGDYRVTCRCHFSHDLSYSNAINQAITTTFTLRVNPANPGRITELIETWGQSVLTNGPPDEALKALAELNDARTIPYLAVLVTNRSHVSYLAVNALSRYPHEPKSIDALTLALQNSSDFVAQTAGKTLQMAHQADTAARELLPGLTNREARIRIQTARALSCTGSELALNPLCFLLTDSSNAVRYAAAQAIGQLGTSNSFTVITNCLSDPDFTLRIAAVRGLIASGRQVDPEWVKPMILGGGENIRTYYDAIDLLRIYGGNQAAPGLASCLHFDEPSVKRSHNFRVILALEFSPNGPKHYYKWHHDPNRDGTEQELEDNRKILATLKEWLKNHE